MQYKKIFGFALEFKTKKFEVDCFNRKGMNKYCDFLFRNSNKNERTKTLNIIYCGWQWFGLVTELHRTIEGN